MNITKVILICSFIKVISSLLTVPPTWVTSPYVQADHRRVINGDACNCKTGNNTTPTGTLAFPTAFASIPNLGYGISNYQGDDGLGQEMIQVKRINLNTISFTFSFQISGFTNLWVVQVRYIGISKAFPHHLNSFDNVPVQYNNGALVNISSQSLSVQTYRNTINYTLQAQSIASTYTNFSMPLSNNKILLFLTSIFISGFNDYSGSTKYPLNLQVSATPSTTSSYLLTVSYSNNSAITRLHFSIIIFDQADVQASGQYLLIYDKLCYDKFGGFYPFQSQFLSNFMIGFVEFSTSQTISVIHFETIYGIVGGLYGARMPQSINRITAFTVPSLTRFCFTYFYMKTWLCPNQTFFDPAQDLCTSCPVINCINCYNLTVCSICNQTAGYFLNSTTGQCDSCGIVIIGCMNCSTPTICLSCNTALNYVILNNQTCLLCNSSLNYFANINTSLCELCTIPNCSVCLSLNQCQNCDVAQLFYLTFDKKCAYCDPNVNQFMDVGTGNCNLCAIPGCLNCSSMLHCRQCNSQANYFLNTTDNSCQLCTIPYCIDCLNLSQCSSCNTNDGYVLNVTTGLCDQCLSGFFANSITNTCQLCAVNNCSICSALTICSVCDLNNSFYLVNYSCNYCDPQSNNFISQVTLDCQPCSLPFCINCSSLTSCLNCNITLNYLVNSTDNLCYLCTLVQCIQCETFITCSVCNTSNGYFLNITSGKCQYCNLSGCILCSSLTTCLICDNQIDYGFDYTSPNMSLCGACNVSCTCEGYGLPWKFQSQTCTPICGDGLIRVNQECDDNNTDAYDGCFNCYVQDYYICTGEPSVCNQTLFIEGQFISIEKSGCNEFKIITKTPNLTLNQISNNIFILNQGISIIKTSQINGSFIEIYAKYTQDIVDQSIILKFSPGKLLNITYQPKTPPIYYIEQECKVQSQVSILMQASQYISYGILLLSLLSCKIIGLQLFGVLQLSYFTLASHNFLNIYLQPLTSFKTFNGLNIQLVSQTAHLSNNFNKLGVAGSFINNCNIMLFLLFGEFAISLILYITAKMIHKQNLKKIALRLMKQGFITFAIFNIFNISFSAGVHWKYANPNDDGYILSSITLCGTIAAIIVAVFALEISAKQDYGEFKNKFKQDWICSVYISLTILYRIVLGFYSAVQTDYQESTLLILAFSLAFVIYFMINLPFSSVLQNYRCFFIHATMLYTLLTTNYYRAMKSTTPMQIKGRIYTPAIIQLVMIVSCIFFSFCVLVHEIYIQLKECYSRKKIGNKDSDQRQNTQQSFQNL